MGLAFVAVIAVIVVIGTQTSCTTSPATAAAGADGWDASLLPATGSALSFDGHWRYRSYHNLENDGVSTDDLVFARGNFKLKVDVDGNISGDLVGGDRNSAGSFWKLIVTGKQRPTLWYALHSGLFALCFSFLFFSLFSSSCSLLLLSHYPLPYRSSLFFACSSPFACAFSWALLLG